VLIHAGGFNLALLMRTLIGVGTPRGLQGRLAALLTLIWSLAHRFLTPDAHMEAEQRSTGSERTPLISPNMPLLGSRELTSATGC
jgi:hypothetical protein